LNGTRNRHDAEAMNIHGPVGGVAAACEQVLRSLPGWFGIEDSLLVYAHNTARLPTFVAEVDGRVVAFLSLEEHFARAWELHCIAVHAGLRGQGIGRRLHDAAEAWLREQQAQLLQVKTLSASHPSPEYAETREFYEALGYLPLEEFTNLWGAHLPVLQLVKVLAH
jgi:GNAT superfamily N-acetyltransferase